jgi:hypothetical protein
MQTTETVNAFNATQADVPGIVATLMLEISSLRAEIRTLSEIVRGKESAKHFDRVLMRQTDDVFEETETQLKDLGVNIQFPPET